MYIVHKKTIADILDEASVMPEPDRAAFLKKYDCEALRQILHFGLDSSIGFGLEVPPYKASTMPEGTHPVNLYNEYRRIHIFEKGSNVPMKRQKAILGQILESLHPKEAQLLERIIRREPMFPGFHASTSMEALPPLLPN